MSLGQFGRMCFNCSTTFSLIGAFVNLCVRTFFPLTNCLRAIKWFFQVGNNSVFFTNSLPTYLNYNNIFLMWDIRSYLRDLWVLFSFAFRLIILITWLFWKILWLFSLRFPKNNTSHYRWSHLAVIYIVFYLTILNLISSILHPSDHSR